ncbi:hypothetical protein AJ78_02035, partial [Emergomyces pasteurianus Ep9510]
MLSPNIEAEPEVVSGVLGFSKGPIRFPSELQQSTVWTYPQDRVNGLEPQKRKPPKTSDRVTPVCGGGARRNGAPGRVD